MSANPKRKALLWFLLGALVVAVVTPAIGLTLRPCFLFDTKTTVILVRHAEKQGTPGDDVENPPNSGLYGPELTDPEGVARAQELAHVAGESGVKAIYHTEFIRTKRTIEPLAELTNIRPQKFEREHTDDLVNDIRNNHRGEVVVVASHGDKVNHIIHSFTGQRLMPDIDPGDFDNLYVVTVSCRLPPRVVLLKYGQQTPPP